MNNLFQYVPGNSVIHRLNPVTKIFLTMIICIAAFVSGNLFYLAGLLAVDLLIGFVAGVPGKADDFQRAAEDCPVPVRTADSAGAQGDADPLDHYG